jgi:spermidine/putrescine-binding protein
MKRKTTFKLTLPICLVTMAIISPVTLSSCSNTGIVLANFESYMSSDLMDELRNEQPIRFVNYATNEDILAKFANSYDIAVPSTYSVLELIKQGLVGKIDWRYLGEKYRLTAAPERPGRDGVIPSSYKPIDKATPHSQEYDPLDPDNSDNAQ